MVTLRIATTGQKADALHAAAAGDRVALCGHRLALVSVQSWDAATGRLCERCQHAVEVLRLVRAV